MNIHIGSAESRYRWAENSLPQGVALLLAVLFAYSGFLLQAHYGIGLTDEGYLWYGVQRVLAGEVPLRDFSSYDPGRYYLGAGLLGPFGDHGLIALRAASYVIQAVGLYAGLLLILRSGSRALTPPRLIFLAFAALVLVLWMIEHFKQYDATMAIVLVAALAALLEKPGRGRYFAFGVTVGLAAVIGRNHGVYGAAGGLLALIYLACERRDGRVVFRLSSGPLYWAAGVVAGYLPILLMALLMPGFLDAFVTSNRMLLELGTTNLTLAIPWPWLAWSAPRPGGDVAWAVSLGSMFVVLCLFCVGGAAYLIRARVRAQPVMPGVAAALMMTPGYAHYALSRADISHLAIGILPFLLAALIGLSVLRNRALLGLGALVLLAISAHLTVRFQPAGQACGWQNASAACARVIMGEDEFVVRKSTANLISDLRRMVAETPPEREVLILPWLTGAYPVLGKRSPVWDVYAAFPRSEAFQRAEIERIRQARPGMIFVAIDALDGKAPRSYRHTHPLIFSYIVQNYVMVADLGFSYLFRPPELVGPLVR